MKEPLARVNESIADVLKSITVYDLVDHETAISRAAQLHAAGFAFNHYVAALKCSGPQPLGPKMFEQDLSWIWFGEDT